MSTRNQVTLGPAVEVTVNGERRTFPADTTLTDILRALDLEPERVAIELDRAIVKRDLWGATGIRGGASLEIVMFVGGG